MGKNSKKLKKGVPFKSLTLCTRLTSKVNLSYAQLLCHQADLQIEKVTTFHL